MDDYRGEFIQAVRNRIITSLDSAAIDAVLDALSIEIMNYDVSRRQTGVVVYDNANEKLIKSFISCMIVEGRSQKTLRAYTFSINRFLAFVGNKPCREVNTYDVRAWLASLKIAGNKNISVKNQKNNITVFFTWLYNEGIIELNPCAPIRTIKVEVEEKAPFSSEDVDAIRSCCINNKERAIVETLLSSGVRVGELCNLKLSDIDFDDLTVRVRLGKGGKDRTTFITPVAKKYIYYYLNETNHNSEYVFVSRYGKKYTPSGIQRMTTKMSNRCGIHVHPHRFRRTLASDLARKGMPIQEVQKLLGHNSIETTRRYTETKIEKVQASYRQYIA